MGPKIAELITMPIPKVSTVDLDVVASEMMFRNGNFALMLLHGSALRNVMKEKF